MFSLTVNEFPEGRVEEGNPPRVSARIAKQTNRLFPLSHSNEPHLCPIISSVRNREPGLTGSQHTSTGRFRHPARQTTAPPAARRRVLETLEPAAPPAGSAPRDLSVWLRYKPTAQGPPASLASGLDKGNRCPTGIEPAAMLLTSEGQG